MSSLIYLSVTQLKNKLRRQLSKPVTYIWLVGIIAYIYMVFGAFVEMFTQINVRNTTGFIMVISLNALISMPTTIISFAKRRGIAFRNCDVNFLFQTPINPKLIVAFTYGKQMLKSYIIGIIVAIMGLLIFHVPVINMMVYMLFTIFISTPFEIALAVFLFAGEFKHEWVKKVVMYALFISLFVLVSDIAYILYTNKIDSSIIKTILYDKIIMLVPLIGWSIASVRIIVGGYELFAAIGMSLYVLSTILLVIYAFKSKCTGDYFEEAISFANEYEEKLSASKKGNVKFKTKSKKLKAVEYRSRATYAKAIFYKQLLEYRKRKTFIFNIKTAMYFIVSVATGIIVRKNIEGYEMFAPFIVPGIATYISIIFGGVKSKWITELENPYMFLIPDSAFRKLFYSTAMDHIKAFVDGAIMAVLAGIILGVSTINIILTPFLITGLSAVKLYINIITEGVLSSVLPQVVLQMINYTLYLLVIVGGVVISVAASMFINTYTAFIFVIIYSIIASMMFAFFASLAFEKMESLE